MENERVLDALRAINQAWLNGRPHEMSLLIHPDVTMVFPGFSGRIIGRDAFIAGFEEFCGSAKLRSFQDRDHQVDVVETTAVANFAFEMVYEREGSSYRATGRDLWVFARQDASWIAVWRTMLDLHEDPV
jgi:hypothetical protein